jgi:hypothetical protein
MAEGEKKPLVLRDRILKPVERRALKNLMGQVEKLEKLTEDGPDPGDYGDRSGYAKNKTKYEFLREELRDKKKAIKDIQDGALAKGKASPPSKTVMKAVKKSTSLLKTGGSAPSGRSGLRVAVDRFNELFQQN